MISRRTALLGLAASTAAGCTTTRTTQTAYQVPVAPPPPDRATMGIDAVIDISRFVTVTDFRQVHASGILGVIQKATEGGNYVDPTCTPRRTAAEAAGLLWGTYHFGTAQMPGERQAAFYLSVTRPGPRTLLALDLELNEPSPANTMRLDQAEEFVKTVANATGRLPVVYVHPTWADGEPLPNSGYSLGSRITPASILARCPLWVADYHDSPEIPQAWAATGWKLWQYAGDEHAGRPAYGQTNIVKGVSHCDRNLFNGDAAGLQRFWGA